MYTYAPAERSAEERDRIILQHLPQVTWIASRIHERLPPSIELDDLISSGILGLLAAVDNFDPGRNATLKTYAEFRIRGAILDSLRGLDRIPIQRRKRLKQVQEAIATLQQRLQRAPEQEEISRELGITPQEYGSWLGELHGVSLDTFRLGENGEEMELVDSVAGSDDTPARKLERAELEKVIAEGIQRMPENEKTVLSLYYKEGLTLREIAAVMDFHLTRISQLRAQGIIRLRAYMERKWPSDKGIY
jgi:RNA polymerase sigma factor for flagellar operon FliA